MTNEEILPIVIEEVSRVVSVSSDNITSETNLAEDLGADSIEIMNLVVALRDRFDIRFSEESVEEMETVGDIVQIIADQKPHADARD